ncbi:DUF1254 domain-containing protein [Cyanobium sp. N.Huapi 1H5]|uniref:DUF1254 domain-containing protein n=1 Tax=Cyanobium sp. N.Huapi 1H5 TaxID=2823719 RepID=UPI0020CCDF09|nr:DUF1254 domain-containing protein [Cyanobium sp. N.Huapi 1H5]MCP9836401.1 DUF1254 domain-containing protein [Cyanobium sp. N.Huapi 1H5]
MIAALIAALPLSPLGSLAATPASAPVASSVSQAKAPSPAEARAIAKEAWLYAYAPLQGYQTLWNQTQNKAFPGYVGGFDRFRHYSRSATPADKDIVTPNNDTPYSWAWLDLRSEPIVLSLPAVLAPRYYVNQWFDLYTHNFAYTGVRSTGRGAGTYLFAGPHWKGTVPKGITKVFRAETDFVGTLTRTQLNGPDDMPALKAIQGQYVLTPLSRFTGQPAPPPAPVVAWPAWDASKAEGIGFITYLNALLPFMPAVPSERAMRARFARIGIGPGLPFDPARLDPKLRIALEEGVAEASQELKAKAQQQTSSQGFFGSRQQLGSDYLTFRSMGAMLGIYGNSSEEAFYATQQTGPDGQVLDGRKRWMLRFEPGQLPPVTEFWSVTMYKLPERLLVENPIQRYSIGDRTSGLKLGADGSLEIYIQSENPGADKASNWLPAPAGPFFFVARLYGPKDPVLKGTWKLPRLTEVK